MKPRSERDKRYEEKHKNERKAKNVVWGTSIPRETAEEIDAFLKKHGYTKVKLVHNGDRVKKGDLLVVVEAMKMEVRVNNWS